MQGILNNYHVENRIFGFQSNYESVEITYSEEARDSVWMLTESEHEKFCKRANRYGHLIPKKTSIGVVTSIVNPDEAFGVASDYFYVKVSNKDQIENWLITQIDHNRLVERSSKLLK